MGDRSENTLLRLANCIYLLDLEFGGEEINGELDRKLVESATGCGDSNPREQRRERHIRGYC